MQEDRSAPLFDPVGSWLAPIVTISCGEYHNSTDSILRFPEVASVQLLFRIWC